MTGLHRHPLEICGIHDVSRVGPISDGDDEEHRRLAEHLLMLSGLASHRLHRPMTPDALVSQIACLEALDTLFLDLADAVLPPEVRQQIASIQVSFGEDAIPRAYQGRDPRLCALVVYLTTSSCEDGELMRLLQGFATASRCDSAHYNVILERLAAEGALTDVAGHVLEHLGKLCGTSGDSLEEGEA